MLKTMPSTFQLAFQIGELLQSHRMLLATAESCTGGGLSEAITRIPGSSNWFDRGFITYSNTAKKALLDVCEETLKNTGAVSKETALEMAKGALAHSPAHISIAITGIAGPDGGNMEKPVGTVWIALAARGSNCIAELFQLSGNREDIRQQAVYLALKKLRTVLICPLDYSKENSSADCLMPPVITLDGPSGTGKGTLCYLVAKKLGWHYLDSGASFRILAHAALKKGIDLQNEEALQTLAQTLNFEFSTNQAFKDNGHMQVLLDEENITAEIRTEECGNTASKIAVFPAVRQTLLERQRAFRKWPGLVTDGRDMGTVIFPDAKLKFFLNADIKERAKRRFSQLKDKGVHATLGAILQDLEERDKRDQKRGTAPLKAAADALLIDTTHLNIETAFAELMRCIQSTRGL